MKSKYLYLGLSGALLLGSLTLTSCAPEHEHVFDQMVTTVQYRAKSATCTSPAKYYYSCTCGEKGPQTFTHGEAAGHSYELEIGGDFRTSYLAGETFDTTGMTATLYCPDCDDEEDVSDQIEGPTTPLVASDDSQKITVTVDEYEAEVSVDVKDYVISDITLEKDDSAKKVFYKVSGKYAAQFDIDNFFFSLVHSSYLYWTNDKSSEKFSMTKNATEKTFAMKVDVTDIVADQVYYPNLFGEENYKANGESRINDYSAKYNGINVTLDNMKFEIISNVDASKAPFCMPSLKKTLNLTGGTYAATSVKLETANNKVLYVVNGTSQGYSNQVELKSDVQMEFYGTNGLALIQDNAVSFTYESATGNFVMKINVTNLASASIPYYTRFGEASGGKLPDFKGLETENVNMTEIALDGKKYKIVYVKGSTSSGDGYGTVSLKVVSDDSPAIVPNSVNLRKDDSKQKVYFVINGVCRNFKDQDDFKSAIGYQLRLNAGNIPKKESDIVVASYNGETGAFILEVDVTDVAVETNPYYMRFGMISDGSQTADFKNIASENVDRTPVTMGSKTYTVFFVAGSTGAQNGWGCVSLIVSNAQ